MTDTHANVQASTPSQWIGAADYAALRAENAELKRQLAWFRRQLFGAKSERRPVEVSPQQVSLLGEPVAAQPATTNIIEITYRRGRYPKQRADDCVNDGGQRFTRDVPVERITVTPPEVSGPSAELYEIIGIKSTCRLAQRPTSCVVLQYDRPVFKRKGEDQPRPSPAPANVLDNSIADVSLLVGLLTDKFQYHLPLYCQHQRLIQAGITLSRATLTNLVRRAIALLQPIADAQLDNVLRSRVLAMDETPIKAGKARQGKLRQSWFWPLYGDQDEVVFTFSLSRSRRHIEATLRERFSGTLLSDGYSAYASYVEKNSGLTHAQCWVHSRRKFIDAEAHEPAAVRQTLDFIARLYQLEQESRHLTGEDKRQYLLAHSKPVVDAFFAWSRTQLQRTDLIPSDSYLKALGYVHQRERQLRVFLDEPDVPLDTNHLECALRPIPMGRKAWLFCWTELGAEQVGIIQSLITTCKLHGINPQTYLTDVLLRISEHPASKVAELTPTIVESNIRRQSHALRSGDRRPWQ